MRRYDGWRVIREFPNYMVNEEGEVRNHVTGDLVPAQYSGGRLFVRLSKDGLRYNRGVRKLVERAFPQTHDVNEIMGWKELPGFPNYHISSDGAVKHVRTGRKVTVYDDSGLYVHLSRDGKPVKRSIKGLLRSVGW